MIILDGSGIILFGLFLLTALAWIIPIVMLIVGLVRLKTRPKHAKTLIIVSGIWLLAGAGFCATVIY